MRHVCDERCVCPEDGLPLLYATGSNRHACQSPDCVNAGGVKVITVNIPLSMSVVHLGWDAFEGVERAVQWAVAEMTGRWVERGSFIDLEYRHHTEFYGQILTSFRLR